MRPNFEQKFRFNTYAPKRKLRFSAVCRFTVLVQVAGFVQVFYEKLQTNSCLSTRIHTWCTVFVYCTGRGINIIQNVNVLNYSENRSFFTPSTLRTSTCTCKHIFSTLPPEKAIIVLFKLQTSGKSTDENHVRFWS